MIFMPTSIKEQGEQIALSNEQFESKMKLYYRKKKRGEEYLTIPSEFKNNTFFVKISFFDNLMNENTDRISGYDIGVLTEEGDYERLLSDNEVNSNQFEKTSTNATEHRFIKIYTATNSHFSIVTGHFNEGYVFTHIDEREGSCYIQNFSNESLDLTFTTSQGVLIPLIANDVTMNQYQFSLSSIFAQINEGEITGEVGVSHIDNPEENNLEENTLIINYGLSSSVEFSLPTSETVKIFSNNHRNVVRIKKKMEINIEEILVNEDLLVFKLSQRSNRKIEFFLRKHDQTGGFIKLNFVKEDLIYKIEQKEIYDSLQLSSLKTYDFYFTIEDGETYYRLNSSCFTDTKEIYFKNANVYLKYLNIGGRLSVIRKKVNRHLPAIETIQVKLLEYNREKIRFQCEADIKSVELMIISRKRNEERYVIFGEIVDDEMTFSWKNIFERWSKVQLGGFYDLYLIVIPEDENSRSLYRVNEIAAYEETIEELGDRHKYKGVIEFDKQVPSIHKQGIQLYLTVNENYSIHKAALNLLNRTKYQFKATIFDFSFKDDEYYVDVKVHSNDEIMHLHFNSLYLVSRNKLIHNEIPMDILSKLILKDDSVVFRTKINTTVEMIPFYYDFFIEATDKEVDNEPFYLPIQGMDKKVSQYILEKNFDLFKNINEHCFYPYINKENRISFTYRIREPFEIQENWDRERYITKFSKNIENQYNNKRIWLVFEKYSKEAHGNAFQFFKYVMDETDMRNIYYVIDPDSPEYNNVLPYKENVIDFMSDKYFLYVCFANFLISSETRYHLYQMHVTSSPLMDIIEKKKVVYLQHGVNGIKRVPVFHKSSKALDFITVPSEYERQMVINQWGYDARDVVVTGFARFDTYFDKTAEITYKKCFVMPTWRKWVKGMSNDEFMTTPFYIEYMSLLSSLELRELAHRCNLRITFLLHPHFMDYIDLFDVDSSFIDKYGYLDVDMGEEIQKSSMMITDYSSVAWDLLYLNRPVIFYQFDQEEYLSTEGTYMNYERELFGDIAFNKNDVIELIEEIVASDYQLKAKYNEMRKNYFTYTDRNNRKRIYETILENEIYLTNEKD